MPAATATATDDRERDAERMAQVAAGNEAAFRALHRDHYPAVFRLALTTVLDREEARDVTQEVFVHLHRIAPRWQPRAAVRTWLYRTTINVALGTGRRLRRWLRPHQMSAQASDDAEARALAQETIASVRDALGLLSPRQRAVVGLHLDAEMSPAEIAEQLGMTSNAVRVALHKGLHRLREVLSDPSPTVSADPPLPESTP